MTDPASDSTPPQPPSKKPGHGSKHVPRSHPALRRKFTSVEQTQDPDLTLLIDSGLDEIAGRLAILPDIPELLTTSQRARLRIIGRELLRRASE
jgi:hypothetical protein